MKERIELNNKQEHQTRANVNLRLNERGNNEGEELGINERRCTQGLRCTRTGEKKKLAGTRGINRIWDWISI